MAGDLAGKVALILGGGDDAQRGVAVALAQAGADVAVGGAVADLAAEAALHSIANELWALGRRATVVKLTEGAAGFAAAVQAARADLGRVDLVLRVEPVLNA